MLTVSAVDEQGGARQSITIANEKGRLSKQQIEAMLADAQKYEEEDRKNAEKIEWKNTLENLTCSLRSTIVTPEIVEGIDSNLREVILKAANDADAWLFNGEGAAADVDGFKATVKKLEDTCNPILAEFYAKRAMKPSENKAADAAEGAGAGAAGAGAGGAAGASGAGAQPAPPTTENADGID